MRITNKELVNRLEAEINKTPTGELRNLLCDANIVIQASSVIDLKDFSITEDAGQRVEWINKRVSLTYIQKEYVEFQIKEAITNAITNAIRLFGVDNKKD